MRFNWIALDETEHWHFDKKDFTPPDRMYGVYIYDPEKHVHCCELTPSYKLLLVYDTYVCFTERSLQELDEIDSVVLEAHSKLVTYMHTYDVDALRERKPLHCGTLADYNGRPAEYESEDEALEDVNRNYDVDALRDGFSEN